MFLVTFDKQGEALAGAAVVQHEARLTVLLHTETWWLQLREASCQTY